MDAMVEGVGGTRSDPVGLVIRIVIAYVAHNRLPASELPTLIGQTHEALCGGGRGPMRPIAASGRPTPGQIRASITHDGLTSFEDGRSYHILKRHLTSIGLTPHTYREKWGLPSDYPMVAPGYSERRSALARGIELGRYERATTKSPHTGGSMPTPDDPQSGEV